MYPSRRADILLFVIPLNGTLALADFPDFQLPGPEEGECCSTFPQDTWPCDDDDVCTWDHCVPDPEACYCVNINASGNQCRDDNNYCTRDTCVNGQCRHLPTNEGNLCGAKTECSERVCRFGRCKLEFTAAFVLTMVTPAQRTRVKTVPASTRPWNVRRARTFAPTSCV